jgi:hypothetical protein
MNNLIFTHEFKGWKYIHDASKGTPKEGVSIIPLHEKPIPDSFYKYFSLTPYNLDALKNNYLYASHPVELNDKFDCYSDLIDYDSATDHLIVSFLQNFHTEQEIKERFAELKAWFKIFFPLAIYSGIGVISVTSQIKNTLMWAHYASSNHGFAIKFNHKYFHEKILGPYPINYQAEWKPISLENPMNALMYATNVKSKIWEYEDEWRFIGTGKNMSTPRYREEQEFIDNRKFKYQNEAIEEIILGNMFIDRINKYGENGTLVLALTPDAQYGKEKFELLHFIVNNRVKTSRIVLKQGSSTFELDTSSVEIQKIDNYSFLMKI